MANGMGTKARLANVQFRWVVAILIIDLADNDWYISYQEQVEKVARLKDETVRNILKNSNDIAMFKAEVSRHLNELREFAEMS